MDTAFLGALALAAFFLGAVFFGFAAVFALGGVWAAAFGFDPFFFDGDAALDFAAPAATASLRFFWILQPPFSFFLRRPFRRSFWKWI